MTLGTYETFIAKSRYSRFLDDKNRREHWPETVDRYMNFMTQHLQKKHGYKIPTELHKELHSAILNCEVMPSMRSIMTAGEALERDNTAGYNCSYLPVDDVKSFDEAMYILLCGTGVGFSVESKYVNKLPEVPTQLFNSDTTISVSDSKAGWAKALRQLIALLYSGEIPKWDTSKVRAAGSRLKVFGGRASGPQPLISLFEFVTNKFKGAAGRKLTSLECHDIMCKIGEVVVVGGVRRSAMISLSDLSDDRMRHAKAGQWWEREGQRALANNSACYNDKPTVGEFMSEWLALYQSYSGERGIFSRQAAKSTVAKRGRRDSTYEFGTNPCSEIILRPYQFCNLTEVVARKHDDDNALQRKVRLASILGTFQSTLTDFPYLRKVWQKNTEEERLLGVSITGILDCPLLNDINDEGLSSRLDAMRELSVVTNKEFADELGIPQSAAITCVKPSGTVSQLVDSASGIHARHSEFYIRRVRNDNKDPITQFLKDQGIPNEADVMKPHDTTVFSFPMKAPEGCITRDELDSFTHLKLWLTYQRHWCEHKPSVTVYVKEADWPEVGAWVWKNFDEISGISFLPWDGGSYKQAPYEEITEDMYGLLMTGMPKTIDWESFVEYDDNVEGAQQLACVAGVCEI
ncbi:RTPR, ribonucleoside-triphosphate reductase, adenosylcobalamin-dependent [uncultured Caudovirales phage]|uniref:RTPR, ribonucleoside-triphosphate reductase, adenosylcobalamin-dependent n=1 Tax=uncultured Caudovirales phage TaxID=2100421 RepID=A0A6J5NQR1_9CAUD|nr:RTPR, ribonucleoside-triphosphate reductase, adenosylcobalamin-dependent [uncultured Caudovirales phage]